MNRILLVDDDADAVDCLGRLLALDGYDVELTTSAVDAVARLNASHFDAVVTDLDMPDGNGMDVVSAARAAHPDDTLVFVLTGHGSHTPAARRALAAGAQRVLAKPLDYDAITRCLAAVGASTA